MGYSKQSSYQCVCDCSPWLLPWGSAQRKQAKTPLSQPCPRRDLTIYIISCCLRTELLISMHLVLTMIFPGAQKSPFGYCPCILLIPHSYSKSRSPSFTWKEHVHPPSASTFIAATRGMGYQITPKPSKS